MIKEKKKKIDIKTICHYCKQEFTKEDYENNRTEFEAGKTKIVKRYAHNFCRQEKLRKDEYYEKLFNILEIQPVKDKNFYILTESMRGEYSWEIMIDALKSKEEDIARNKNMPIPYINKIIFSQLVFSERDVKQRDKNNKKQNRLKEQVNLLIDEYDIEYKKQDNKYDITNLLD